MKALLRHVRERGYHIELSMRDKKTWQTWLSRGALVSVTSRIRPRDRIMTYIGVLHILKNCLKLRKIASRWIPKDLMEAQRWIWYNYTQAHLESYDRDEGASLRHIIALVETWARSYEPTNVKVMVILVYDCDGVIQTHTILQRQTVDAQYFCHFGAYSETCVA